MADNKPNAQAMPQGVEVKRLIRRRRVVIAISSLLAVALICVASIVIMLQRLEARNASFQPPMTALERQRLLPTDPVLDAAPRLDGLHYRDESELRAEGVSPAQQAPQFSQVPLTQTLRIQGDAFGASSDVRTASHTH